MTEGWLVRVAGDFWTSSGGMSSYPRNLEYVASYGFPVSTIPLVNLSILQVELWFQQQQVPFRFLCQDRALRGCIVAVRGKGLIFIDYDDPEDEKRYTIAHELAHFLLDYIYPRQKALELFGEAIRSVLDGERPPTDTERMDALLCNVKLGSYFDLMPRTNQNGIDQGYILRSEVRADRLALELLAPAEEVLSQVALQQRKSVEHTQIAMQLLTSNYGLPLSVAQKYSRFLFRHQLQQPIAEWLGL